MSEPVRQTALWHTHQRLGAEMADFCGWRLPKKYGGAELEQVRARAGLADWSCLGKFDLKGSGLIGAPVLDGRSRCWRLGGAHFLATCEPGDCEMVRSQIGDLERGAPGPIYCTDITSVLADLLIVGPDGVRILGKLTSAGLSESALPDGGCVQSSVGHVRSIILRRDLGGLPAFHLLMGREYSESIWETVLHAGEEFHLAPFGFETYRALHSGAGR